MALNVVPIMTKASQAVTFPEKPPRMDSDTDSFDSSENSPFKRDEDYLKYKKFNEKLMARKTDDSSDESDSMKRRINIL